MGCISSLLTKFFVRLALFRFCINAKSLYYKPVLIPVGGLTVRSPLFLILYVWQETEKAVLKSEAIRFINIPCLALYLYSAQRLGETLAVLWMLKWAE